MVDQRVVVSPAKIIEQRTYLTPGKLEITEHHFACPKDYHNPSAGTLRIFARSARRCETPIVKASKSKSDHEAPKYIVWLTGGPGQPTLLPQDYPFTDPLLDRGYTFLTVDHRGTGLSSPITASTLQQRGDEDVQAAHMRLYRADSIVRDCEAIRLALTSAKGGSADGKSAEGKKLEESDDARKWSIFGQSFGGFISLTYLSFYPQGLRESFIFGGLAPITVDSPDDVYRRLYKTVERRNMAYYQKFPEDVARVKKVVAFLARFGDGTVRLPGGGRLTGRRFMQMGIDFGFHGKMDTVHDIVLKAVTDIDDFGHLTRNTLSEVESFHGWDDVLIYSILHEPIYCQGKAANWAAHRLTEKEFPQFNLSRLSATKDSDPPLLFTGEMIYPWMLDDCSELEKLKTVAEKVAAFSDWPALYDLEQLAKNEVPVYAAAYTEDMYVDYSLSMETASKVKNCHVFSTNVWYHNAIKAKCKEVMDHLFALRDDVID